MDESAAPRTGGPDTARDGAYRTGGAARGGSARKAVFRTPGLSVAYRIADGRHPIFDATGAMLHGGRWSSIGARVIYAAESYAGALLEVLVHAGLSQQPPKNHRVIRIEIPKELRIETANAVEIPGWDAEDAVASRAFGDEWIRSGRGAVLRVPGVVTHGREFNLLLNTLHQDFAGIRAGEPEPVHWDPRLFRHRPHAGSIW